MPRQANKPPTPPRSPQHPPARPREPMFGPRAQALWARYRALSGKAQILVACLALVLSCAFCGALASAGGNSTLPDTTLSANQAGASSNAVTSTHTSAPTDTPMPTATKTPKPTPTATERPAPPPPTCIPGAVNCNPWGYNLSHGSLISAPPGGFCGYFACISTFWNGRGYVVECQDGEYSLSGGESGVCSRHGGELQPLYA